MRSFEASVADFASTRLLDMRTAIRLADHTTIRPDLALLTYRQQQTLARRRSRQFRRSSRRHGGQETDLRGHQAAAVVDD
jgi:hypothetical protein